MKKQIIAAITTLPLVIFGTLANTGVAKAATITADPNNSFNFFGIFDATLTSSSIDFIDAPVNVYLTSAKGTFSSFGYGFLTPGSIKDLNVNSTPVDPNTLLLDLQTQGDNDGVFTIDNIGGYKFVDNGSTTAISVQVTGLFRKGIQTINSIATLSFNAAGNESFVRSQLADGNSILTSFSGAVFTAQAVPEPTAILGLGLVAGSLAVTRRRKVSKIS